VAIPAKEYRLRRTRIRVLRCSSCKGISTPFGVRDGKVGVGNRSCKAEKSSLKSDHDEQRFCVKRRSVAVEFSTSS